MVLSAFAPNDRPVTSKREPLDLLLNFFQAILEERKTEQSRDELFAAAMVINNKIHRLVGILPVMFKPSSAKSLSVSHILDPANCNIEDARKILAVRDLHDAIDQDKRTGLVKEVWKRIGAPTEALRYALKLGLKAKEEFLAERSSK